MNRNINISTPDTSDNVKPERGFRQKSGLNISSGVIALVIAVPLVLLLTWAALLAIAKLYCWGIYAITCTPYDIVFYAGLSGFALLFVSTLFVSSRYAIEQIKNLRYLNNKGVYIHRSALEIMNAPQLFKIVETSAKSEATSGIDTWSPSMSSSSVAGDSLPVPVAADLDDTLIDVGAVLSNINKK